MSCERQRDDPLTGTFWRIDSLAKVGLVGLRSGGRGAYLIMRDREGSDFSARVGCSGMNEWISRARLRAGLWAGCGARRVCLPTHAILRREVERVTGSIHCVWIKGETLGRLGRQA